jgi:hypothetical protein
MDIEKLELKANAEGWFFRRNFPAQLCVGVITEKDPNTSDTVIVNCGHTITSGFLHSPGMNYPLCAKCSEREFNK